MKTEFNTNISNEVSKETHKTIKKTNVSSVQNSTQDVQIRKVEKGDTAETRYEPEDDLKQAMEDANKRLSHVGRELRYSVHGKTKQLLIKIVDSKSDEVILEIPREKSLDNLARVLELSGVFIDEKR